jgi:predicted phage terminase large subunit-like protein
MLTAARLELARRSFRHFVPLFFDLMNPSRKFVRDMATDAIADHLQAVRDGVIDQLLILTPPGTLKSFSATVAFPAWTWIDWPATQFVCAAGSETNAHRDSVACRDLIRSEVYQRAYVAPEGIPLWRLREDQDAKSKFENTLRGFRDTATSGQTVTGRKGDILIGDDLMDARKVIGPAYRRGIVHWYDAAFWNRVNDDRQARRVVMGQHVDPEDLQTYLIRKGGWVVLRLEEIRSNRPAYTPIWTDPRAEGEWLRPLRHGPEERAKAQRALGVVGYETQHNQNPRRQAGKMFDRANVNVLDHPPVPLSHSLRYWDVASSKESSACWTCGVLAGITEAGRLVILDAHRGHWEPTERNKAIRTTCRLDMLRAGFNCRGAAFENQPAAAGKDFAEGLMKFCAGLPVFPVTATGDKFTRAIPLASYWAEGLVDVVAGDWTGWFLDYMEAFERGAAANMLDVGDATSGAFNRLTEGAANVDPGTGSGATDTVDSVFGKGAGITGGSVMTERF